MKGRDYLYPIGHRTSYTQKTRVLRRFYQPTKEISYSYDPKLYYCLCPLS